MPANSEDGPRKVAERRALGFMNEVGADDHDHIHVGTLLAEMTRLYVVETNQRQWDAVMAHLQKHEPDLLEKLMRLRIRLIKEKLNAT